MKSSPGTRSSTGFLSQWRIRENTVFPYRNYPSDLSFFVPWNASSRARSGIHRSDFAAGHLFDFPFAAGAVVHQNNSARHHLTFEWLLFDNDPGIAAA